ncbi:hypothetical protein JCM10295v2_002857 [Rhodotorula toruloides]
MYQKSLYEQYWIRDNGAITDGVLHLAYAPDSPRKKAAPKHPDNVRAEYEGISATIDWMVGERGSYGAALVVYGQPGCGKSRFLRIERARLFEEGRPCIVTTTERSTFDLYCDAGAFFDIRLRELEALDLLIPTIALVDAAEGANGGTDLQHAFVNDFIADVVVVFAASPRVRRWSKLSGRLVPTLYWTMEGWPDNEIDALPHVRGSPARKSSFFNHAQSGPTRREFLFDKQIVPPTSRIFRRRSKWPPDEGGPLAPPSTFLPEIEDHHYHLPAGFPPADPLYSLPEACLSSLVHVNLLSGLPDAPDVPVLDAQAAEDLAKLRNEIRIKENDRRNGFYQFFADVSTPDVARPSLQYPRSILVPASAPLERLALVHGIIHEVYSARTMELCGALAVLADGSTLSIPRLSRVSIVLPLVRTTANIDEDDLKTTEAVAKFDYEGLSEQKPTFPLDESFASTDSTLPRLRSGIYFPQVGFPALDAVAIFYHEDELLVVALQMTMSMRHDVNINGILSLYTALGRFAFKAKFYFAFVAPTEETGRALVKHSRPALPANSLVSSTRSSSSDATKPFTWSRAFTVADPKKPVQHVEATDD